MPLDNKKWLVLYSEVRSCCPYLMCVNLKLDHVSIPYMCKPEVRSCCPYLMCVNLKSDHAVHTLCV